jgi:3-oxoacyl-[acyl-carrier-protein] synthase II
VVIGVSDTTLLADRKFHKFLSRTDLFGLYATDLALHAQARQAHVLGEFLGSGCTTEATGIVEVRPDGDGLSRAIELALAEAELAPGRIGLVVAHEPGSSSGSRPPSPCRHPRLAHPH